MKEPQSRRVAASGEPGDFYALLGLDQRYDLDLAALEANYLAQSRTVHPDRFVNAPASERVWAVQQSMQLNQAYKTLKRPIPRAEYLLVRHGITIAPNQALDPGFLMEVLELREELQEAKQSGDRARLGRLEAAMLAREDAALADVAAGFAAFEDSADPDALEAVKRQVIHLRYIARYLEEFDEPDEADRPGTTDDDEARQGRP